MMQPRVFFLPLMLSLFILSCENEDGNLDKEADPYILAISALATDDKSVWVGTDQDGLFKIEGESVIHYTRSDGLVSDTITCLVVDQNGILWIGTKDGISVLENAIWTTLTTADGLHSNDIRCLANDHLNNIWIGTRNNRMLKYDGTGFTVYHVDPIASGEGELGHIHTITCEPSGVIWVGSCISGLSRYDGAAWTDQINGLNSFVESSVRTEQGDIWIGHYTGAYQFSNDTWTGFTKTEGLADDNITCLAEDKQNNIWIGTLNGLSKYDGNEWVNHTTDDGLPCNCITALACDQNGDMWIGTSSGLLKLANH
jgi:ligand-binding sensor domain-containing protein